MTTLIAMAVAVITLVGAVFGGIRIGAGMGKAKANRAKLKAQGERLEMHREATEDELKAAGKSDEEAKQEALRWSKR